MRRRQNNYRFLVYYFVCVCVFDPYLGSRWAWKPRLIFPPPHFSLPYSFPYTVSMTSFVSDIPHYETRFLASLFSSVPLCPVREMHLVRLRSPTARYCTISGQTSTTTTMHLNFLFWGGRFILNGFSVVIVTKTRGRAMNTRKFIRRNKRLKHLLICIWMSQCKVENFRLNSQDKPNDV